MLVGLALERPFTTPTHPYQTFVVLDIAYIMQTLFNLISENGHRVTQDNVWRHQEWVRVKLPLSDIT